MRLNPKRTKAAIEASGRTRKWLCEQLSLTEGTFTQYVNGWGFPGKETLVRLATLLGVDTIDIVDSRRKSAS